MSRGVQQLLLVFTLLPVLATPQEAQEKRDRFQESGRFRNGLGGSEQYATVLVQVLPGIARSYHFQANTENALAGRAVLGLYRAGGVLPPEKLLRDPDHYFDHVPGANLYEKIKRARDTAGESPAIQGDRGIHASMHAVFQSLDVFSNYSEVDSYTRKIYEQGAGIGLYLEDKPLGGSYFVRNIEIDSPAHKQGIRPGDELLEIDRESIKPNTSTAQVNAKITISSRRRNGVTLTVRTLTGEKKIVEISMTRHNIDNSDLVIINSDNERETQILGYRPVGDGEWDYWVDRPNRIALLRLGTILSGVNRVHEVVSQLQQDGLKGLIIDLRDCPSGYPESSADLAGYFVEEKSLIAKTHYRNPTSDDLNRGNGKGEFIAKKMESKRFLDVPMAVLIGPDTSGAAELIAAALQDHQRAKIIGERSRGKSTIQEPYRDTIRNLNFSYRLTVGVFMRPSRKNLHRTPGANLSDDWGVRPDIEVVLPAFMRRQVRAWWFEHDIRPPDSLEPTKIDDVKNDPVLDAAVRLLKM